MESPYSPYLSILSLTFMVPKHILEKLSDPNSSPFHNAPVGPDRSAGASAWRATTFCCMPMPATTARDLMWSAWS